MVNRENKNIKCKRRKLIDRKLCDSNEQIVLDKSKVVVDYQKLVSCVSTDELLGDEHINAVNLLLRSQFPDLQGLCTPVLGQQLSFPEFEIVQGYAGFDYCQVLHTGSNHWVTIQVLSQEEVHIYDSVSLKSTFYTLKQIASIVKCDYNQIQVFLERVQCQKNAIDCGIYAIAFLTDLCHRRDPASLTYHGSKELRQHLIKCFEQGAMSPFPSNTYNKPKPLIKDLRVYCCCRLPFVLEHMKKDEVPVNEETRMIQCDLCNCWYHCSCIKVTNDQLKEFSKPNVVWTCEFKGCSAF